MILTKHYVRGVMKLHILLKKKMVGLVDRIYTLTATGTPNPAGPWNAACSTLMPLGTR